MFLQPLRLGAILAPAVAWISFPAQASEDAELLALELSGELSAPPALIALVDADLTAVRAANPMLGVVHVLPDWVPGQLRVRLTVAAFQDFEAGTYTGLDSLNAVYGPVEIVAVWDFIWTVVLQLETLYNPELLGPIYETAPGVADVQASPIYGDDHDITAASLGTYTFRYAWFDCPLGCVYEHFWLYEVTDESDAQLISEWGDPLVGVDVPQVSDRTGTLSLPRPNPFRDETRLTFSLKQPAGALLTVVDVAGRRVRTLAEGEWPAGTHSVAWDGNDEDRAPVTSGVYFVLLESPAGSREMRRVTLIR